MTNTEVLIDSKLPVIAKPSSDRESNADTSFFASADERLTVI